MLDLLPPVCILAGGLGSRLGERARETPKPLLEIDGEPFLLHQLRLLASQGARDIVLCVGYLGDQIERRIGMHQFGLRISYSRDGQRPLGTLGAVRGAADRLGQRFLVLYGDTYLRLDYRAAAAAWEATGLPAMMTVIRNDGRWDSSNATFDGELVAAYDKRNPLASMRWIDYGLGGLEQSTLELLGPEVSDLADLYHELSRTRQLFGFVATERFYEIGTPEALAETAGFLVGRRNRSSLQG